MAEPGISPLAHLVHIGLPKTGTVSLRAWFKAHPQIAYTSTSLGGYRSLHHLAHDVGRQGAPHCIVTSSEQFSMPPVRDKHGSYDYDKSRQDLIDREDACCARLARLFPAAHVLIVTRGFNSILLSSFSQYARTGGGQDFGTMWPDDPHDTGSQLWDFDRVIGRYRRAFGHDRVIVLPYELLRNDPQAFVGEIERAMGLAHFPLADTERNPSLSPAELVWYPPISRQLSRVFAAMPLGHLARRLYLKLILEGRLRWLAKFLQAIRPLPLVPPGLPEAHPRRRFQGRASLLAKHPLYQPYRKAYLLDEE